MLYGRGLRYCATVRSHTVFNTIFALTSVLCCAIADRFVEDAESGQLVDYYALLGVKQDATRAEIKAAYYDLARVCHPDVAGNPGNNLCVLLNEAYSTLKCVFFSKVFATVSAPVHHVALSVIISAIR